MLAYDQLKEILKKDEFSWSKHALDKCSQYGYDEDDLKQEIIEKGELIEYHFWYGYGDKYLVQYSANNV
jgi:hypothetical protein